MSNRNRLIDLRNLTTLLDNGHGMVTANSMLAQEGIANLDEKIATAAAVDKSVSDIHVRVVSRRLRYLRALLEEQESRCRRVREEVESIEKNISSI